MHGNIERRQPLIDNALQLGLIDIRQRQVVPEEEREPVVLILDMQRRANARGILMDETEHAVVLARQRLDGLELQPEGFPFTADKRFQLRAES